MNLLHPFQWISRDSQKWAFIVFVALTLAVMTGLRITGDPLVTANSPSGIVSFEFAGRLSSAQAIIESWGAGGRVYAGINLGLDYLFLVVYAGAIGLGCVLVAGRFSRSAPLWALIGSVCAWGQILAAVLDAVENTALIRVLLGSDGDIWPVVAKWCAFPKFALVALGLAYLLFGTGLIITSKKKKR